MEQWLDIPEVLLARTPTTAVKKSPSHLFQRILAVQYQFTILDTSLEVVVADILDFFAAAHTPGIHARGAAATAFLLDALAPQNGQHILEIGFGTGQTLVEIAAHWPGVALFGVEKSPRMMAVARRRLRFCGMKKIGLQLVSESANLPYPAGFFDAVYCESVLAIMPADVLENTVAEIFRVLKPGGAFVFNESVWRDETPLETIAAINRECRERFGIPQASEQYPFVQILPQSSNCPLP